MTPCHPLSATLFVMIVIGMFVEQDALLAELGCRSLFESTGRRWLHKPFRLPELLSLVAEQAALR